MAVLSSDKHKMNALFYDKIIPMHSMKDVPLNYRYDLTFVAPKEILGNDVAELLNQMFELINEVQYGGKSEITLRHSSILLGGNGSADLLKEGSVYNKIFTDGMDGYNTLVPNQVPIAWLRDAVTLMTYELSQLYGYKRIIPVFTGKNIVLNYMKYAGLLTNANKNNIERPVIEIIDEKAYELIEDANEWEQIRDVRRDSNSINAIRKANNLLNYKFSSDKNAISDEIDESILDFEEAKKKHDLQFKRVKKSFYIDALIAASSSLISGAMIYNGSSSSSLLPAIIGTALTTSKACLSFKMQKSNIELPKDGIVAYLQNAKERIETPFKFISKEN